MDLAPKLIALTVLGGSVWMYLYQVQRERNWRTVWSKVKAVEIQRMYINPNWTASVSYTIDGVDIESKVEIHARADGGISWPKT